jgi:hypothetical protein
VNISFLISRTGETMFELRLQTLIPPQRSPHENIRAETK